LSDSPSKSIAAALALFWDIARFRRGPEDLPVSSAWLVATVVAHAVLGLVIAGILPPLPPRPGVEDHSLAMLLIDVIVALLWGRAILQVVGRPERFRQMMTAVFGVQLVMQPALVTAYWLAGYLEKGSGLILPAGLLVTALSVWALLALARVLRSATGWPMFPCAVLVIAQNMVTFLVAFAMFPDMAALLKQDQ
jgi:hypothetical protein